MFNVNWAGNTWLRHSSWVQNSVHVNWFTIMNNNQCWSMATKLVESWCHICTRHLVSRVADPILVQSIVYPSLWHCETSSMPSEVHSEKYCVEWQVCTWTQQPCQNLCLEMWCKWLSQLYICSQPLRLNLGENIAATPASVSPEMVAYVGSGWSGGGYVVRRRRRTAAETLTAASTHFFC